MPRVSQQAINQLFAVFCRVHGMRLAKDYRDVGGYALDHGNGGYQIVQISRGGGVRVAFTERRYSPSEFKDVLYYSIRVKEELESENRQRLPGRPYSVEHNPKRGKKAKEHPAPYHVHVWEERDRLHIMLADANDDEIMSWWDDDARQMFEDGFFERGRRLQESVVRYAKDMGIV